MAGVDRVVKHYRVNHETGERTLNTSFNVFIFLNAIAYIINLVLIFTVGPFGNVSNTTELLTSNYQTIMTIDKTFFKVAWVLIISWQGFWVLWQIIKPSERNCEGVVRAAYFYPFTTAMYAGYTISCRARMLILACAFAFGVCGTLVGLSMSMNRFRAKIWKGYMLWQGPMTLHAAWMMVETMLITNVVFDRLDETWTIKLIIAGISLLVLFVTAISWLSSYPVDFIIPFVLMVAIGGIYLELKNQIHYNFLVLQQNYKVDFLDGFKYTVLAVFLLILVAFIIKIVVVLLYSRPKDQEERRKKRESRVSVSITIDTGAADRNNIRNSNRNNNNNNNRSRDRSRDNDRPKRRTKEYDVELEPRPSTPVRKTKKKKAPSSSKMSRDRDTTDSPRRASDSPRTPKKKSTKKKKVKDKSRPQRNSGTSTSETSYDNGDDIV